MEAWQEARNLELQKQRQIEDEERREVIEQLYQELAAQSKANAAITHSNGMSESESKAINSSNATKKLPDVTVTIVGVPSNESAQILLLVILVLIPLLFCVIAFCLSGSSKANEQDAETRTETDTETVMRSDTLEPAAVPSKQTMHSQSSSTEQPQHAARVTRPSHRFNSAKRNTDVSDLDQDSIREFENNLDAYVQ